MSLIRNLTVAAAASFLLALPAHAGAPWSDPSDMVRGSPTAPVTVIEYASVGCPHCGVFHRGAFVAIKKKYIDTGKVRWVAREMITGDPNLASGGFMLARCAGKAKYFAVTDAIYAKQPTIYEDLVGGLRAIAADASLNSDQFRACVTDQKGLNALNKRTRLAELDKVNSTPTLMIRGKVVGGGELTLAEFDKIYARAARAAARRRAAARKAEALALARKTTQNIRPAPVKAATKPQAKPAPQPTPKTASKTPARK